MSQIINQWPALTPARFNSNKLKLIWVSRDHLNELIYDKDIYKKYLSGCGDHNADRFPLYNVIITYYKKREKSNQYIKDEFYRNYDTDYQEQFEFLRTENGYRLLSAPSKKQ